jgi:hypothetical protein
LNRKLEAVASAEKAVALSTDQARERIQKRLAGILESRGT